MVMNKGKTMNKTGRQNKYDEADVIKDVISEECQKIGLVAMDGSNDPKPSIKINCDRIVEMDGKKEDDFDFLDKYIAKYGINKHSAEKNMKIDSLEIARMLVDINVSRREILHIAEGLTPAKLAEVVGKLNVVEIMMAQMKMRARKSPANQAHVVNIQDNPVLLVADAAEAAYRGFAELETTCSIARYGPIAAIALMVGSQMGRPGVITQCSLEEATELSIGMKGLTSYAETVSVYGTEGAMVDGGDTPWSKAFLSSAYASRGMKMRFSSGSASEVMMGSAEGKSMLYLEARCLWLTKACGSQGTQNGAIDGLPVIAAVPAGLKAVAAENLIASMLGLEVASGNDTYFSHSLGRSMSKLLMQMLPGTDLICSGYSSVPNEDSTFCGSTFDCDNYPDFYMVQRDMKVDGGIHPVDSKEVVMVRRKAANMLQALFEELDFPIITDEEVEAAVTAYTSEDMPKRNISEDLQAAGEVMKKDFSALNIIRALYACGYEELAQNVLTMLKQRLAGDYLQTSAIFDENFKVKSAINDENNYHGPGTGYIMSAKRWKEVTSHLNTINPTDVFRRADYKGLGCFIEKGEAKQGTDAEEVIIALSPSFGKEQTKTIVGLEHKKVIKELCAGIEEEGMQYRIIKVKNSSDLATIASEGSCISGSGISIGIQSKGTAVIHQKDLVPLDNLELFPQSPLYNEDIYRKIGRNAAKYAKGQNPEPIPGATNVKSRDFMMLSVILHNQETQLIENKKPIEIKYVEEDQ